MIGRRLIGLSVIALAWLLASGHTPYGHWSVYRQHHLLILTSKTDPQAYATGQQMAALLLQHLPASRARAARAPHNARIASLISSKQLDLALMRRPDAVALRAGLGAFQHYATASLRALVELDSFVLVCRDDFPADHALQVTTALLDNSEPTLAFRTPRQADDLPVHPAIVNAGDYQAAGPSALGLAPPIQFAAAFSGTNM